MKRAPFSSKYAGYCLFFALPAHRTPTFEDHNPFILNKIREIQKEIRDRNSQYIIHPQLTSQYPLQREYLKIKYLDGKDADLEGFDLIIVALGVEPREILSRVF